MSNGEGEPGGPELEDTGRGPGEHKKEVHIPGEDQGKQEIPAEGACEQQNVQDGGSKTPKEDVAEDVKILIEKLGKIEEALTPVKERADELGSISKAMGEISKRFSWSGADIAMMEAMGNNISKLSKALVGDKSAPADTPEHDGLLKTLHESQMNVVRTVSSNNQMMRLAQRQIEESQLIPDSLKNPTPERMLSRMSKIDQDEFLKTRKEILDSEKNVIGVEWDMNNEAYQTAVKGWLVDRMEEMERRQLSFEEQGNIYTYLMLHINNFALTPETRNLGEELGNDFERRRILQMVQRVYNLSTPDQILGVASRMTLTTFAGFFKDEDVCPGILDENGKRKIDEETGKEMENPIEVQLRNYERMGRILRERRDELRHFNRILRKDKQGYLKYGYALTDDDVNLLKRMLEEDLSLREHLTNNEKDQLRRALEDGIRERKLSGAVERSIGNSKKRLGTEIKAKEQYIGDYYKLGGSIYDEGLNGAYVGSGEYNGSNDNVDGFFYRMGTNRQGYTDDDGAWHSTSEDIRSSFYKAQIKELRVKGQKDERAAEKVKEWDKNIWAKKYAGRLWSLTFRAAYHDVQLNGTGDFYAARIMNFSDRLAANALMRNTREHWDPSHRDNPYEIGLEDVITNFTDKIKVRSEMNDEEEENMREILKKLGIMIDDEGNKIYGRPGKQTNLKTLENFKWGSSELWNEAMMDPEVRPPEGGAMAIRYTRFNDADKTRQKSWGADSFFHKATTEGLIAREDVHAERGASPKTYKFYNRDGSPMMRDGEQVKVEGISGQEWGWIDDVDRSCENYLRSPEGEGWLGSPLTGYAEMATIREWINTAVKNGMLDDNTRDILLDKNFGTHKKFVLNRMSEISVIWNDFRTNWGGMTFQTFLEFLKRAFGYVLTDELRA